MIWFVIVVSYLVKEECHTAMLHDDMNLSRLMVYAQSIEESKLGRIAGNMMSSGTSDQRQPRFKKKTSNHNEYRGAKFKLKKGSGSKNGKHTCATCGKRHYGECLLGTGSCFWMW